MIGPCCSVTMASASCRSAGCPFFYLGQVSNTHFPCTDCFQRSAFELDHTCAIPCDILHTHNKCDQPHAVCVNSLPCLQYRLRMHSWLRRSITADVSAVSRPLCGICRLTRCLDEMASSRIEQHLRNVETGRKPRGEKAIMRARGEGEINNKIDGPNTNDSV